MFLGLFKKRKCEKKKCASKKNCAEKKQAVDKEEKKAEAKVDK